MNQTNKTKSRRRITTVRGATVVSRSGSVDGVAPGRIGAAVTTGSAQRRAALSTASLRVVRARAERRAQRDSRAQKQQAVRRLQDALFISVAGLLLVGPAIVRASDDRVLIGAAFALVWALSFGLGLLWGRWLDRE